MRPHQTLPSVFVLFLLLSRAFSCTLLADVVASEQRRYISYQQRGAPKEFTEAFFEIFLQDISNYVQNLGKAEAFSSKCLTSDDLNVFYGGVHDRYAIDRKLADIKTKFPDIPYITNTTSKMMMDERLVEQKSKQYFSQTWAELSEGNVTGAAVLPETLHVLYDPARAENLKVYAAHSSNAPRMSAIRLLRIVTGMVITLELAEVQRASSTQLLRHAVAWLSNVFRALQNDGPHIEVPVLFIPFYENEFHRLMKTGRHKVPLVTEKHMETELNDELETYCHLDAWGRLEIIVWKVGESADMWTIETALFDPDFLAKMAKQIGFDSYAALNYPPFDSSDAEGGMDGWIKESTEVSNHSLGIHHYSYEMKETQRLGKYNMSAIAFDPTLETDVKQTNMCNLPIYVFFMRPDTTWEEKCCASVCCNAVLMLQISLSVTDCCRDCNQGLCQTTGSPLASLAVVHLQPYGCDDGGAVPVSL